MSEDRTLQSGDVWPVFICYRQIDGLRTAERIYSLLDGVIVPAGPGESVGEASPRLHVYFDQVAPSTSDWTKQHEPHLQRARAFIVICTPGAKLDEGTEDWVHREIDWWLQNRDQAPIVIDAVGQGERYVPTPILEKWPKAQRINVIPEVWDKLDQDDLRALKERTQARIVGGITRCAVNIYLQEIEREQQRSRELSEALASQKKLSNLLKRAILAISLLFVAALALGWSAHQQQLISESQKLAVQAEQILVTDRPAALGLAVRGYLTHKTKEAGLAVADAFAQPVIKLDGHTDDVNQTVFSPDGKHIVTASDDCTARVWNPSSGKLEATLEGHLMRVNHAAYSSDGKHIVTASDDGSARVWNSSTGKLEATFEGHLTMKVNQAAFSPNGMHIIAGGDATTSQDGTVLAWNLSTGKLEFELEGHSASVRQASFSPDGRHIVTASDDKTAKVWNASTGQLEVKLEGTRRLLDRLHSRPMVGTSSRPVMTKRQGSGMRLLANWKSNSKATRTM
jgi:hypothetical protein